MSLVYRYSHNVYPFEFVHRHAHVQFKSSISSLVEEILNIEAIRFSLHNSDVVFVKIKFISRTPVLYVSVKERAETDVPEIIYTLGNVSHLLLRYGD